MPENVPPGVTPFVFSDPLGKRWPRLRTFLLITGVLVLLRCGFVCGNAIYRTANDGALFLAAVEGTVEVAPKTKSGRAKLHAELVALAKIRGDKAGDKKVSKANDGGLTECHAGATSSQGAR